MAERMTNSHTLIRGVHVTRLESDGRWIAEGFDKQSFDNYRAVKKFIESNVKLRNAKNIENPVQCNTRIPKNTHDGLKKLAKVDKISVSHLVQIILEKVVVRARKNKKIS